VNQKRDNAGTRARKRYIRSIIDAVGVDDTAIRIIDKQRCPASRRRRQTDREQKC
jgi:hypothetical protein